MRLFAVLCTTAVMVACALPASAAGLIVTSSSIGNDGRLSVDTMGSSCGGKGVSPGVTWSGAPPAAASYAVTVYDADGRFGQGVSHLVAYGIASAVTSIPAGFATTASAAFVGGTNQAGTTVYAGVCPPVGGPVHHYLIAAYALDLTPAALAPGLTRDAFITAITGHVLATGSVIGIFGR